MRVFGGLTSVFLATALAGCSALPKAGPSTSTVIDGARQQSANGQVTSRYAIYNIDENVVSALARHKPVGFRGSFGMNGPAAGGTLGVGDVVAVTIYEATTGGLFSTGDVGTGVGTKSTQLPPQQVARDGTITVPFAGQVRAAGYTPAQVSRSIAATIAPKAIEPQVIVSMVKNDSSTVSVSGEVGQGGVFPLSLRGDRVLDAIAAAGGPRSAASDIYVRLIRNSSSAVVRLSDLISDPRENVYVRSGDQVFLYSNPQSFTVLGGGAGKNDDVKFEENSLTLAQALGKAGGLIDARSDPAGVFIFRYEDPCVYADLKGTRNCSSSRGARVPIVYRIDFKDPGSLLLAQRFAVRDKDVLYMAVSPSQELYKFLQLIGAGFGIVDSGANVANIAR